LRRLLRAYGTRIDDLLAGAASAADLGRVFGADLTEAELRYLVRTEFVHTAEDVVWRRSKLGLRLSAAEIAAIDDALLHIRQERMAAA
jgi:glycerol-3-phosphate dehydrogenase